MQFPRARKKTPFDPRTLGCRCDECPLGEFYRKLGSFAPVPPEGDPESEYVLIGDEPGPQEVQYGRPFVGPSGALLERTLNRLGVYRKQVFIDNGVMCRAPGNDLDTFNAQHTSAANAEVKKYNKGLARGEAKLPRVPTPQEACRPHIEALVDKAAARKATIITLGKNAYASVTGKRPAISNVRGSFVELVRAGHDLKTGKSILVEPTPETAELFGHLPRIRVVATYNPAYAQKEGNAPFAEVLHRDLERAIRWHKGELQWENPIPNRLLSTHPDARWLADWLRRPGTYTWDLETAPAYRESVEDGRKELQDHYQHHRENKIRVLGIYCCERDEGVVIPWVSVDGRTGFAPGVLPEGARGAWPTPPVLGWRPNTWLAPPSRTLRAPWYTDQTEAWRVRGSTAEAWWLPDQFDDFHYNEWEGDLIWDALCGWYASNAHWKIGHFSNYFDKGTMLRHIGPVPLQAGVDQIILARMWNSELPRGLYFIGTMLTDVPAWKASKDDRVIARNPRSQQELSEYNLIDNYVVSRTYKPLIRASKEKWDIVDLDHRVQEICVEMSRLGLWIHEPTRAEIEEETRSKLAAEHKIVAEVAGKDFNPRSTQQLAKKLFEEWKYPIPELTKTAKPSTGEDAIRKLLTGFRADGRGLLDDEHRIMLEAVWRSRGWQKDLSDVVLPMRVRSKGGIVHEDGVLRADYSAHIPATGRMSSGGPNCFDGRTEILTETGWVRFDELQQGVRVAQFHPETRGGGTDPGGSITWVAPTDYVKAQFDGDMIQIGSFATDLFVTPNHRCLIYARNPHGAGSFMDFAAHGYPNDLRIAKQLHILDPVGPGSAMGSPSAVYDTDARDANVYRVPWSGVVYCVSVPSSYIVVRRNGKVAITGQTQNWRKRLRRMIRPRPGHLFVMADYDQIELRVMSAAAQVVAYLRVFADPKGDPHAVTALLVYGAVFERELKIYQETGTKTERFTALRRFAKTFVYAVLYGGTAKTVYDNVSKAVDDDGNLLFPGMTFAQVEAAVNAWMRNAKEIPSWWKHTWKLCEDLGYVEEPIMGRRRHMPAFLRNEALNMPIQAAAGIVMSKGLVRLREAIPPDFAEQTGIVNQMHDAATAEVPEARAEEFAQITTEALTLEFPDKLPNVVFSAKGEVAIDWSEKHWRAPGKPWQKILDQLTKQESRIKRPEVKSTIADVLALMHELRAERLEDQFALHKLEDRMLIAMKRDEAVT